MLQRVASHLGALPAAPAAAAATAPQPQPSLAGAPGRGLTDEDEATFHELGFVVCRDLLTPDEAQRLAAPIHAGFKEHLYEGGASGGGSSYPDPSNRYSLGSRVLLESPDVASVSCDHPKIVSAVERLLGSSAVLSQYQSYLSPPGYDNAGASVGYTPGHGCHYDYKPYRPVGSFLSFIFAVVPLSHYTPDAGPLLLSPRSHLRSRVLPSDGRVHRVEVAAVPPLEDIELVDPNIRPGDVVFMHCYCWHAYCPNTSDGDRFGLYMKYHPKNSPPSNGPLLHPQALAGLLSTPHRHLTPYTCSDARYYSHSHSPDEHGGGGVNESMQTIDRAALLLEDEAGRVLLQQQGGAAAGGGTGEGGVGEVWGLPSCEVGYARGGYMDNSNVIGQLTDYVAQSDHDQLGLQLQLPWMSWIADHQIQAAAAGGGGGAGAGGQEEEEEEEGQVERVYAHRLGQPGTAVAQHDLEVAVEQRSDLRWFTLRELAAADDADGDAGAGTTPRRLAAAGAEATWLRMWQREEDEEGQPVQRGYGFALNTGSKFGYTHFDNTDSSYTIGDFEANELPPFSPKLVRGDEMRGPGHGATITRWER